jgi:hypothetical protein
MIARDIFRKVAGAKKVNPAVVQVANLAAGSGVPELAPFEEGLTETS